MRQREKSRETKEDYNNNTSQQETIITTRDDGSNIRDLRKNIVRQKECSTRNLRYGKSGTEIQQQNNGED